MIAPVIILGLIQASPLQTGTIVLERGKPITGSVGMPYWDVTEGEIDAAAPNMPIPRMFGLTGDVKRNVLMRFGSLDLAVGPKQSVDSATLTLAVLEGDQPALKSIRIVRKPWMSAGVNVLSQRFRAPAVDGKPPFAPGLTWNRAGGDTASWQTPGGIGNEDSEPISGAKIENGERSITISGLGPAIESMRQKEGENFGFLLEFSAPTGIWSSLSPESRPQLSLQLKASDTMPGLAHVTSAPSDKLTLKAPDGVSKVQVFQGATKLSESKPDVDASGTFTIPMPKLESSSKDPRADIVRLVIDSNESNRAQSVIELTKGPWIKTTPIMCRLWNHSWVDQSNYSFAPFGAMKYINAYGDQDLDEPKKTFIPFNGLGSNQTDTQMLPGLSAPVRSMRNVLFAQLGRPVAGPLTMFEVDWLLNGTVKLPIVTLGRFLTTDGEPLPLAKVKASYLGQVKDFTTDDKGLLVFPQTFLALNNQKLEEPIQLTVETNGQSDSLDLPMWYLTEQYARGNTKAVAVDLPFNISSLPVNMDANLASGKPVKDSGGSFPAQLIGLVDDNPQTVYELPTKKGSWVEIDLGRDRSIAEVNFIGQMPGQFQVLLYGTTDKLEDADIWIQESNFALRKKEYKNPNVYRPRPNTARFIRIVNLSNEAGQLGGIEVRAGKKN